MSKFNVVAVVMARIEMPIVADSAEAAAAKFEEIAKFKMEQGWLLLTRAEMMAMRQTMRRHP